MSVSFDHRDPGTPEAEWQQQSPWKTAAHLSLNYQKLVVVAAHPDDETLGAAGLIMAAAARHIPITVVVLSDGLASHAASQLGDAARRRKESVEALNELAPQAAIRFEGLPDGMLRENAAAVRDAIVSALGVDEASGCLLVAPWWGDGHRDHRVVGEIAAQFVASGARVFGYPVWMWHWAVPDTVDTQGWFRLDLPPESLAVKRRAIARHESQVLPVGAETPIVHEQMRSHFERDVEVFIDASSASAKATFTPEWFEGFYARHDDPWGFESRWYEKRKRAVLMAALPKEHYVRTLELGCATGLITERLAERSDKIVAVDIVPKALEKARARVPLDRVDFVQLRTPHEWPGGTFDLIVLSELGYYWSPSELALALEKVTASLAPEGVLVGCHWRAPIEGCVLTGDDVHAAVSANGFRSQVLHLEDEFVLEMWLPKNRQGTHG